jgi:hypothetical protein
MSDLTVKRTLVKSPPELWSELSEVEQLAKHLGAFGEIKITKLEPEHTVAWEGEGASGTVSIEASGWGTKVTLTALLEGEEAAAGAPPDVEPAAETVAAEEAAAEAAADAEPEAAAVAETTASREALAAEPVGEPPAADTVAAAPIEPIRAKPRRRRSLLAWLFRTRSSAQIAVSPTIADPPVVVESEPEPEPVAVEPEPEPDPVADAEHDGGKGRFDPERAQAILDEVLDALGSAHHRPFSRG